MFKPNLYFWRRTRFSDYLICSKTKSSAQISPPAAGCFFSLPIDTFEDIYIYLNALPPGNTQTRRDRQAGEDVGSCQAGVQCSGAG